MPFTPLLPTSIQGDTPSKELIKIHKPILKHVGVLSCIRSVPAEIWQNIFSFAPINIENLDPRNPYDKALRALCNVCTLCCSETRHWRRKEKSESQKTIKTDATRVPREKVDTTNGQGQ
ncbi:hypothetical protein FA13DRAFT_100916 [Coprinellus micaceus]|uniref:Uncharacterized protein n=1 Tax=Coprinellus micaceus TaxID=71717 RepID=A0A4Y7SI00_COPMI|nr:hypothetical protein FA13DRAFT_100916 [Coprinellus micaceus]